MEFATSKVFQLLTAAVKAGVVREFIADPSLAVNSETITESLKIVLFYDNGRTSEFTSSRTSDHGAEELEFEASIALSQLMHTLHAHGADWLPDYLKDNSSEEIPASE